MLGCYVGLLKLHNPGVEIFQSSMQLVTVHEILIALFIFARRPD